MISHLRIFGCNAYVFITEDRNLNSHPEPTKCILIDYDNQLKAFQCYKPQIEKVVISWNVVFDEEHFAVVTEDCQEGSLTFDDIDFLPNDKQKKRATNHSHCKQAQQLIMVSQKPTSKNQSAHPHQSLIQSLTLYQDTKCTLMTL